MKIAILGRQPELSLAELESQVGHANVTPFSREAALVSDAGAPLQQSKLGGTMKIGEVIATVEGTSTEVIFDQVRDWLTGALADFPEGKISIGASAYGLKFAPARLQQFAFSLKKAAKSAGRSARTVPNKTAELSTAQVLHNRLTDPRNLEILLVSNKKRTVIARTISVQNIDEYSDRDYGRPRRSAKVGMLPPKLAQIMLNLAQARPGQTVLDPFCGTGVVLQEAALLGSTVYGTDVSEQMVRYTRDNLQWLEEKYRLGIEKFYEVADATTHTWRPPVDKVVCETFLGTPLSALPSADKLREIMQECDEIIKKFLQNLAPQLTAGTRCTIAVPAWAAKNTFLHLPVIDQLGQIGYNQVSFVHASKTDLIYHRSDQIVARELLVLTRK